MKKNKNKIIVITLLLIVAAGASITVYTKQTKEKEVVSASVDDDDSDVVTYKGKKYRYNPDMQNILFLGVDRSEKVEAKSHAGEGGQADTILLLAQNKADKSVKMLEISRDTMMNVSIYDDDGTFLSKEKAQIALQYAYGNSTKRSSQLMKNTVSNLLYGIPIRNVIMVDVDGIAQIVDALGGVKMRLLDDYSGIDPAFTAGAELVMNGEQAESYVRYRDTTVTGSNNDRMNRQNQFMRAIIEQLKNTDADTVYNVVTGQAGEYIYTDLSADQIKKLGRSEVDEQIESISGEMKEGREHDEFYADETLLYEKILKMFYKPAGE